MYFAMFTYPELPFKNRAIFFLNFLFFLILGNLLYTPFLLNFSLASYDILVQISATAQHSSYDDVTPLGNYFVDI